MEFQAPTSHDTALCLIPPEDQWSSVDRLRFDNDKAYSKWPPHVNLIYPFVKSSDTDSIRQACGAIVECLKSRRAIGEPTTLPIHLDSPSFFQHKTGSTLFLSDTNVERTSKIDSLRTAFLETIANTRPGPYKMHMTIAQCEDTEHSSKLKFILEKLRRLPPVSWEASQLAVLVRTTSGQMRLWGLIDLVSPRLDICAEPSKLIRDAASDVIPQRTWHFSREDLVWQPVDVDTGTQSPGIKPPGNLVVASWNVLAEFHWPPSRARYPLIVENLLTETALADIAVLQEVTDDFLPFLLKDERVRDHYAYASHGSPDDSAAGPLPNILNNVVLSKYPFSWDYLPSKRQHKGSCIVRFERLGHNGVDGYNLPLILATCHLSQGLTDGAVVAKEK